MYEVGSKVIIKTLAELISEYEIGVCGDIRCNVSFTRDMRKYCGKMLRIVSKETTSSGIIVYKLSGEKGCNGWDFTSDMFRAV